jgi:hypothetical protein
LKLQTARKFIRAVFVLTARKIAGNEQLPPSASTPGANQTKIHSGQGDKTLTGATNAEFNDFR